MTYARNETLRKTAYRVGYIVYISCSARTEWYSRCLHISIDQTPKEEKQYLALHWQRKWRQCTHRLETFGKRQIPCQTEPGPHGFHKPLTPCAWLHHNVICLGLSKKSAMNQRLIIRQPEVLLFIVMARRLLGSRSFPKLCLAFLSLTAAEAACSKLP